MAQEGVLKTCWAKVQVGGRFVLDTSADVRQLAALVDASRAADSHGQASIIDYLNSGRLRADFGRLLHEWGDISPAEAYQGLKRITVNQGRALQPRSRNAYAAWCTGNLRSPK